MANNFPQLPGDKNEGQSIDWSAQRNLARQWGAEAERQLKLFQQIPFEELTEEIIHSYEYWTRIKEESGHVFAEIHKAKQEQKQARNKSGQTKEERTAQYSQQAQEKYIAGSLALLKQAKEDRTRNFKESQKVINNIEKRFGSARIAQAFRAQYMNKENKITPEGEKTAVLMQRQQVFIRRLVQAIGSLPVFQKVGRAFQQLGVMTMMSGIAKFRQGGIKNQLQGVGQTLLGLGVYLAPAMASAFGTVMTNIVAKKIIEAVAIGTMKGNLGGGGGLGKYTGRLAGGAILGGLTAWGASSLEADQHQALAQGQTGKANALGMLRGGVLVAGFGAAIAAAIAGVFAPITLTVAGIAVALFAIGKLLNAPEWFSRFNKDKKGGGNNRPNPSWTRQDVGKGYELLAPTGTDPGKQKIIKTDRFDIYRYGDSSLQTGKGASLLLRKGGAINPTRYTRKQLEEWGSKGYHGLETLQGSGNVRIDYGSFLTDATVARVGTSQILRAVGGKMAAKGYGPLMITSAMGTDKSPHAPGKTSHYTGQTLDFRSPQSYAEADKMARDLKATGYFSHAEAEYDRKLKTWHVDARIADEAYLALEKAQKKQETHEQQQKQVQLQKTSPRVKEAPGTAKVTDVINGSLGLRNSLYGPAIGI